MRLPVQPLRGPALPLLAVAAAILVVSPSSAAGFTPATQRAIAREAVRLAPPDLARQIERRERHFLAGVAEPFQDRRPARHNAGPAGVLDRVIVEEANRAVEAIRSHQPFDQVIHQLGVVSHYVADANYPLNTSSADPREDDYAADFARYVESAEPRLPLVFYGLAPGLDRHRDVAPLVALSLRRGRELYPLVGREYRRIGFASGVGRFDDRSSAFGIASLSFSHAVSDVARVLRWIWLQAGGADRRDALPELGGTVLRIPRRPAEDG